MAAEDPSLPRTPSQATTRSMEEAAQRYHNALRAFNDELERKRTDATFNQKILNSRGPNGLLTLTEEIAAFSDLAREEMYEAIGKMKLLRAQLGLIEGRELGKQISAAEDAYKEFKKFEQHQIAREGAPGQSAIEKIGFNQGRIFVDTTAGSESTFAHWSWDYDRALDRFKDMPGVEKFDREMYVTPPLSGEARGPQGAPGLLGNWPQRSEFNTYYKRVCKCLDKELYPTESIKELINSGNMSGTQWAALDAKIKKFNADEAKYKANPNPNLGVGSNNQNNAAAPGSNMSGAVTPANAAQAGLNVRSGGRPGGGGGSA